jgi:hypothetical protein
MTIDRRQTIAISQVAGLAAALAGKVATDDPRLDDGGGGAPDPHAATHETGGSDAITALDASVLTSGTLAAARLPAGTVNTTGTPVATQLALFTDADTIVGDANLTWTSPPALLTMSVPTPGESGIVFAESGVAAKGRVQIRRAGVGTVLSQNVFHNGSAWIRDDATKLATVLRLGAGDVALTSISIADVQTTIVNGGPEGLLFLKFAPTHSPSADPYALDDYREGAFLPTITGSTGASGQSYALQVGRFVKIGRLVFVFANVKLSMLGTISGSVGLGNLPVPAGEESVLTCGYWNAMNSNVMFMAAIVRTDTPRADIFGQTTPAAALATFAQAHLTNATQLYFSGSYFANA